MESCSLLSSYTSCSPGANNLLGLHAVFVKVYPECDGFPVPFVIDFSERGLQSGKLFSCHYTILVYYSYTLMLKYTSEQFSCTLYCSLLLLDLRGAVACLIGFAWSQ